MGDSPLFVRLNLSRKRSKREAKTICVFVLFNLVFLDYFQVEQKELVEQNMHHDCSMA